MPAATNEYSTHASLPSKTGAPASSAVSSQPPSHTSPSATASAAPTQPQTLLEEEMALRERQDANMNALREEINKTQPLISPKTDLIELYAEYSTSPVYTDKIHQLQTQHGFTHIRRIRGDGNCFYRAYMYACFELAISDPAVLDKLYNAIQPSLQIMSQPPVSTDPIAIEDFYDIVMNILNELRTHKKDSQWLFTQFTDEGSSMWLLYYSRCLTAMYMKLHVDDFAPFVEEGETLDSYIEQNVMRQDQDAEQLQIIALTSVLNVPVTIQYLDLSSGPLNSHSFPETATPPKGQTTPRTGHVNLLYRPSHYELLYRERTP